MMHAHRCGICRYIFTHGTPAYDDEAQHMCPRCNCGPWWKIHDDTRFEIPLGVLVVLCAILAAIGFWTVIIWRHQ